MHLFASNANIKVQGLSISNDSALAQSCGCYEAVQVGEETSSTCIVT